MPRGATSANLFTSFRLILVPYIIGAILDGRQRPGTGTVLVAAVTDVIDGASPDRTGRPPRQEPTWIPGRQMPAQWGFFWRWAAPKRSLVVRGWWSWGATSTSSVGGAGGHGINQSKEIPAQPLGKISTFVQIATAVTWMVKISGHAGLHAISSAMLWVLHSFLRFGAAFITPCAARKRLRATLTGRPSGVV